VLFDLDDTLLDYTAARDAGFVTWLAERDPARPTKDLTTWQALEDTHFRRYSAGEITFGEQRRARLRAFWPHLSGAPEAELDQVYETYVVHMEAAWSVVPHAPEVVRALTKRMPVGVLTNGNHAMQLRKLRMLGLEGVPLYASSELVAPKPDSRAYEAACTGLGVPRDSTVMVGDDIINDVQGALLAGLSAVWFDRGRGGAVDAPSISDLRQLLA
jgi:putative hydrolase of the HAD superfamily